MSTFNTPKFNDNSGEQKIKRYVHTPIKLEHQGVQFEITANGRVILSEVAKVHGEDVELITMEVPASLILKIDRLLKDTRQVVYLSPSEMAKNPAASQQTE